MENNLLTNGIYRTEDGNILVYLGRFEGTETVNGVIKDITGHMYWDVTERYGKESLYKIAFQKDLCTSFEDKNNNLGKIILTSNEKTDLTDCIGKIDDVIGNILDYQNRFKNIVLKRTK